MKSAWVMVVAVLAAGVAVGATAGGAGEVTPTPGAPPTEEQRSLPAIPGPTSELEARAREAYGEDFAGIALDENDQVFVAVRTVNGRAAASALGDTPVRSVTYSLAELQAAQDRLDLAFEEVEAAGVVLAEWWVDRAANTLAAAVVGTEADLAAAERVILDHIGPTPLALQAVASRPQPTSRTADADPHKSGARMDNASGTCTSGPLWNKPGGGQAMMTAGHCRNGVALWLSGGLLFGGTGSTWNGLDIVGTNRIDALAMTSLYSGTNNFYTGGPTSNTSDTFDMYYVSTYDHLGLTGLKTGGAITGEQQIGTGTVVAVGVSAAFGGGPTYHLNRADCNPVAGDSGGPVYHLAQGEYQVILGLIAGDSIETDRCLYVPTWAIQNVYGGTPAA